MRFALKRGPERLRLALPGRAVAVAVIRHPRARRMILRLDPASGMPVLTLPPRTSLAKGEAFVHAHAGWLEAKLERRPDAVDFADGALFPLRGEPCRIVHRGGGGMIRLASQPELSLSVPGDAAHLSRRVADWLKRQARHDLQAAVARCAAELGRAPPRVRIGDAKSRWGSCSSRGVLAFSWRLVLAPPAVLDYLAAHEAAHLLEMNHGPRFWALVDRLHPERA